MYLHQYNVIYTLHNVASILSTNETNILKF